MKATYFSLSPWSGGVATSLCLLACLLTPAIVTSGDSSRFDASAVIRTFGCSETIQPILEIRDMKTQQSVPAQWEAQGDSRILVRTSEGYRHVDLTVGNCQANNGFSIAFLADKQRDVVVELQEKNKSTVLDFPQPTAAVAGLLPLAGVVVCLNAFPSNAAEGCAAVESGAYYFDFVRPGKHQLSISGQDFGRDLEVIDLYQGEFVRRDISMKDVEERLP